MSAAFNANGVNGRPTPEPATVSGNSTSSPASTNARVCHVTVAGDNPTHFATALRGNGPAASTARRTAPALLSPLAVTSSPPAARSRYKPTPHPRTLNRTLIPSLGPASRDQPGGMVPGGGVVGELVRRVRPLWS